MTAASRAVSQDSSMSLASSGDRGRRTPSPAVRLAVAMSKPTLSVSGSPTHLCSLLAAFSAFQTVQTPCLRFISQTGGLIRCGLLQLNLHDWIPKSRRCEIKCEEKSVLDYPCAKVNAKQQVISIFLHFSDCNQPR